MEVGDQTLDDAKPVAGVDEERRARLGGLTRARPESIVERLQRPRRRGADGDDAPAFPAGAGQRIGRRRAETERLGIDLVLLDVLDAHRLERAVADVQRDCGRSTPARAQVVEHLSP